jgi:hypothetical protein
LCPAEYLVLFKLSDEMMLKLLENLISFSFSGSQWCSGNPRPSMQMQALLVTWLIEKLLQSHERSWKDRIWKVLEEVGNGLKRQCTKIEEALSKGEEDLRGRLGSIEGPPDSAETLLASWKDSCIMARSLCELYIEGPWDGDTSEARRKRKEAALQTITCGRQICRCKLTSLIECLFSILEESSVFKVTTADWESIFGAGIWQRWEPFFDKRCFYPVLRRFVYSFFII